MTVVYQGKCSNCMRVGVAVPLSGTMSRLRKAVAQETKIPAQQVPLTNSKNYSCRKLKRIKKKKAVKPADGMFSAGGFLVSDRPH